MSGFDRSIKGMLEENVVGLEVLMTEYCSIAGLDKTTIVGEVQDDEKEDENCRDGFFGVGFDSIRVLLLI